MDPAIVIPGLVALTVVGVAATVWQLMQPRERSAADRLGTNTPVGAGPTESDLVSLAKRVARYSISDDGAQQEALRKRLLQAGFRRKDSVERYSGLRTLLTLGLGALAGLVLFSSRGVELWSLFGTLLVAALGYYGPHMYISNIITNRQNELMKGFADALDLLVSCVEAGLGLDAAFRRVADEIESASPELSGELQLVGHEVSAGMARVEALRRLSDRTGLDEINSLVNVLIQAERFGASVAKALRVHSDGVRTRRMQRAETKAGQVSPKLTVVMILFILPCLMVILLAPAMIRVINNFAHVNTTAGAK